MNKKKEAAKEDILVDDLFHSFVFSTSDELLTHLSKQMADYYVR